MTQTSRKHTRSTSQRRITSHPRSWWFDHYQAWQAGDLSKSAYCAQQGLNVSSFSNWTTRFAREGGKTATSPHNIFFKAQAQQASEPVTGRVRALSSERELKWLLEGLSLESLSIHPHLNYESV